MERTADWREFIAGRRVGQGSGGNKPKKAVRGVAGKDLVSKNTNRVIPAMAAKKASKGKRYSDAEKAEILAFIDNYGGRGGQSAAAKKFKVSQLTLANWRKSAGNGPTKAKAASGAASGLELEIATAKWLGKQGFEYELFQSLSSGAIDRKTSKGIEALGLFSGGDYTIARIGKGGEPVIELSLSKLLELTKTKA